MPRELTLWKCCACGKDYPGKMDARRCEESHLDDERTPITPEGLVKYHNDLADECPGQMSRVKSFDDLLPHQQVEYERTFQITEPDWKVREALVHPAQQESDKEGTVWVEEDFVLYSYSRSVFTTWELADPDSVTACTLIPDPIPFLRRVWLFLSGKPVPMIKGEDAVVDVCRVLTSDQGGWIFVYPEEEENSGEEFKRSKFSQVFPDKTRVRIRYLTRRA